MPNFETAGSGNCGLVLCLIDSLANCDGLPLTSTNRNYICTAGWLTSEQSSSLSQLRACAIDTVVRRPWAKSPESLRDCGALTAASSPNAMRYPDGASRSDWQLRS